MAKTRELQRSLSIVVLGTFNPPIFDPLWLAQEDLVRPGEAEAVALEIVHPEVTAFQMDWFRLEVTRERLLVRSARTSHFEALRDLVVGSLDLLRHTPTRALGVNHEIVFECDSRDRFDKLGWTLAPEDNWSNLKRPGLALLHEMGQREDGYDGFVRVIVEPNLQGELRVRLEVNDHFEFSTTKAHVPTLQIGQLLNDQWAAITRRANAITRHVRGLVT